MARRSFSKLYLLNTFSFSKVSISLLSLTICVSILSPQLVKATPVNNILGSEINVNHTEIIAQNSSSMDTEKIYTNNSQNYSSLKQEIIKEINRSRTDPAGYANWLESMKQYFDGSNYTLPGENSVRSNKGLEALDEAIVFLKTLKPLEALNISEELNGNAKNIIALAANPTNNNSISQDENITYGKQTAEAIVMQLIMDDGVADRHHRRNLLNINARNTGIACGDSSTYKNICVITLSNNGAEKTNKLTSTLDRPNDNPTPVKLPDRLLMSKNGSLAKGDATLSDDGSLYDSYLLKGNAGDTFTIEVNSKEFDPFVAIVDSTGKTVAQNDDASDRDSNCRLQLTLPSDGEYHIIINSYQEKGRGRYNLKLSQ
jgi:uncharacterized protein YkwD